MKYPNYQKRTKVYRVINNVTRIKLLLMVNKNIPLVYAAKQLQINYNDIKITETCKDSITGKWRLILAEKLNH